MDAQRISRRDFAKTSIIAGTAMALSGVPFLLKSRDKVSHLCILHTNDTHSRIDPYPSNDPNFPNMGGYARRSAFINKVRNTTDHVLLLDAGDIFQGTPYYNAYGGEAELKLMSMMKYDAATMGNHEFDNGLDGFLKVLPHAEFPFITSNYDFSLTPLREKTLLYKVFQKGNLKIGVYGLGIELVGLVGKNHFGETIYHDPVKVAGDMEIFLKEEKKCDLIICLSHLGLQYETSKVSDIIIAQSTRYTNIILGGHTHTLLQKSIQIENAGKKIVHIGQAGYGGVNIGRMDVYFDRNISEILVDSNTTNIFKNQVT